MARTLRVVNYAVNGGGVGHLTRLCAVNRWIRRYAAALGVRAEIYFLTSSEADGLLFPERFASFKLPSKTVVGDAGIDKTTYLALAKQWVWHSLALIRPDLLVVDSFPRGSFGELLSALDLCHRRAFVYRPMKPGFASRADFQAMLPLYDAILVPDAEDPTLPLPADARERTTWLGPVMIRERIELLPRGVARARLGVPDDRLAVYVSAGGGGDPGARSQLAAVLEALETDPSLHLVVGAGPLHRGPVRHGPHVTWLTGNATELMAGFDLAVSAAGYNTFFELMHAGVPAVFIAQEKIADEQARRAERAVAAGAALLLPSATPQAVREAVARLVDPAARAAAAAAAAALVPRNFARDLAAELLRLVLPGAEVELAEEIVTDELLAASAELELPTGTMLELVHLLVPALDALTAPEAERASRAAIALARTAAGRGWPFPALQRFAQALLHRLPPGGCEARAAALLSTLEAFAPFEDWAGATSWMKLVGAERRGSPAELAAAIGGFLARLQAGGEDLYAGIRALSAAQAAAVPPPAGLELLDRASEVLAGGRRG